MSQQNFAGSEKSTNLVLRNDDPQKTAVMPVYHVGSGEVRVSS